MSLVPPGNDPDHPLTSIRRSIPRDWTSRSTSSRSSSSTAAGSSAGGTSERNASRVQRGRDPRLALLALLPRRGPRRGKPDHSSRRPRATATSKTPAGACAATFGVLGAGDDLGHPHRPGSGFGFVKIVRDLTTEKQEADEREALQRTFAHDLLSPVTALRGYLDLIGEELPPTTASCASPARRATTSSPWPRPSWPTSTPPPSGTAAREPRPHRPRSRLTRPAGRCARPRRVRPDGCRSGLGRCARTPTRDRQRARERREVLDDLIEVDVFETDEGAVVRVRDRGRGIHPDDLGLDHAGRQPRSARGCRRRGTRDRARERAAHRGRTRRNSTHHERTG